MYEVFRTHPTTQKLEMADIEKGAWINLIAPSEEEISDIISKTGVPIEFVIHPLDPEERSRIDTEGDHRLIIIDIPIKSNDGYLEYETIPLGIILTKDEVLITVCSEDTPIMADFKNNKIKQFFTFKKTRFVFQLLHQISNHYLKYLKDINRKTDDIERELHKSMKNKELFSLLSLEKSLVFFTTSLKSNEIVMEKILRTKFLVMYEEDEDVLEEAIIENKQAIEMSHIYSTILSGMMDAFASVISNNLNIVMKFLTSITIVLAMPTMVASFYGMNVNLPFQNYPDAFTVTIIFSLIASITAASILAKKKLF